MSSAKATKTCVCGRRVRIRLDGNVQRHSPITGWQETPICPQSGRPFAALVRSDGILKGQIGLFGDINMFTDCAMEMGKTILTSSAMAIMEGHRGLPHSCPENQRCSRWVVEQA